ncbi:MAG: hypothetical protein IKH51_01285, partial [Clostridia bacterium]|nr:hypothetical protein [Clostridia bacterium]
MNKRTSCVKSLENTKVFTAAFALPVRPFAPRKLRSTREREKIEIFLRRQGKAGWRPASAKAEKEPIWVAHGRQVLDALRPAKERKKGEGIPNFPS